VSLGCVFFVLLLFFCFFVFVMFLVSSRPFFLLHAMKFSLHNVQNLTHRKKIFPGVFETHFAKKTFCTSTRKIKLDHCWELVYVDRVASVAQRAPNRKPFLSTHQVVSVRENFF